MKRKIAIIVLTVIILTVFITLICCINENTELETIKSEILVDHEELSLEDVDMLLSMKL